jgi:hypothetical protein
MTLTVATISRSSTMEKGCTVASVRLSCRRFSALHPLRIDDGEAVACGVKIGAAGEGGLRGGALSAGDPRNRGGCLILRHVISAELRGEDRRDAGSSKQRDIIRGEGAALLEHAALVPHRMGEDRTFGLGKGHFPEDHLTHPAAARASFPP